MLTGRIGRLALLEATLSGYVGNVFGRNESQAAQGDQGSVGRFLRRKIRGLLSEFMARITNNRRFGRFVAIDARRHFGRAVQFDLPLCFHVAVTDGAFDFRGGMASMTEVDEVGEFVDSR